MMAGTSRWPSTPAISAAAQRRWHNGGADVQGRARVGVVEIERMNQRAVDQRRALGGKERLSPMAMQVPPSSPRRNRRTDQARRRFGVMVGAQCDGDGIHQQHPVRSMTSVGTASKEMLAQNSDIRRVIAVMVVLPFKGSSFNRRRIGYPYGFA